MPTQTTVIKLQVYTYVYVLPFISSRVYRISSRCNLFGVLAGVI